jgi:hypothetical protein
VTQVEEKKQMTLHMWQNMQLDHLGPPGRGESGAIAKEMSICTGLERQHRGPGRAFQEGETQKPTLAGWRWYTRKKVCRVPGL